MTNALERVLVVGHGTMGKRYCRLLKKILPDVQLGVVTSQDSPEYADQVFLDLAEAVKFQPQAAVIANPSVLHIQVAITLAEIGCHLLIEKPLSDSLDGINDLIKLRDKGGLVISVGYNLRHSRSLIKFKEFIDEKLVGGIMSVRADVGRNLMDWRPELDYRQSVSSRKNLGGGVVAELSHEIDYLEWIFGRVQWVQSNIGKFSTLEIDVEDSAFIHMQICQNDTGLGIPISLNMDFVRKDNIRNCIVIGEDSSIRWDGIAAKISLFNVQKDTWEDIYIDSSQRDETYIAELNDFFNTIRGNLKPNVGIEQGLRVLNLIHKIKQSSEMGFRLTV